MPKPLAGLSASSSISEYAYGQLRMNALPDWNSLRASSSMAVLKPGAKQPLSSASAMNSVAWVARSTSNTTCDWSS